MRSRRYFRILSAGLFLGFSCAAYGQVSPAGPPSLPQVPTSSPMPQESAPGAKPSAATGAGEPVSSSSYKIGAADVLNVHVWNEAEFSGPVMVHEDGMITLPLVGDLKAGQMTPSEVEKEITEALSKYVKKALVTVTVQQVGSKQYYMDGEINRPGEFALVVPTTVLEAISKAGGIHELANAKKIYILRGDQRIKFNYKDVLRGKNMSQNIQLKPGDHVVVP